MSQLNKKRRVQQPTQKQKPQQQPQVSYEIEDNYAHLQTILMLTQLNVTYHELAVTLQRTTLKIQNKYRKTKLLAFMKIAHHRPDWLDIRARELQQQRKTKRQQEYIKGKEEHKYIDEDGRPMKLQKILLARRTREQTKYKLAIECKMTLTRAVKKLNQKQKGILSYAFNRILSTHESTSVQFMSEKSSKIETNDTQKSKIFQRSLSRKGGNRKSFSLQKGGPEKHDYYVPVKFQPPKQKTAPSKRQEQNLMSNHLSSSLLNKVEDKGTKEKRITENFSKQKSIFKASSSKHYLSMSMLSTSKQQKIKELEYLRGKYRKLMDEFNWFSDRFLRVIQEEDYVQ